jgi:hypothetical protein
MRKLPDRTRNIGTAKVYRDHYISAFSEGVERAIAFQGDTVVLLKPVAAPFREIDTTGVATGRGRYGARRDFNVSQIENPKTFDGSSNDNPARSETGSPPKTRIPAIVDLSPAPETRQKFGYVVEDNGIVTFSKKFLDGNNIEINAARDSIEYRGQVYKLRSLDPQGTFLDSVGAYSYIVRRSS